MSPRDGDAFGPSKGMVCVNNSRYDPINHNYQEAQQPNSSISVEREREARARDPICNRHVDAGRAAPGEWNPVFQRYNKEEVETDALGQLVQTEAQKVEAGHQYQLAHDSSFNPVKWDYRGDDAPPAVDTTVTGGTLNVLRPDFTAGTDARECTEWKGDAAAEFNKMAVPDMYKHESALLSSGANVDKLMQGKDIDVQYDAWKVGMRTEEQKELDRRSGGNQSSKMVQHHLVWHPDMDAAAQDDDALNNLLASKGM